MTSPIGRYPISSKGKLNTTSVVIANGASLSTSVDLTTVPREIVGIEMPAAWTAAALAYEGSRDGTAWGPIFYGAEEYNQLAAEGAAADARVTLDPLAFGDWPYVRVRSGPSTLRVNQGAERTLVVLTRDV